MLYNTVRGEDADRVDQLAILDEGWECNTVFVSAFNYLRIVLFSERLVLYE